MATRIGGILCVARVKDRNYPSDGRWRKTTNHNTYIVPTSARRNETYTDCDEETSGRRRKNSAAVISRFFSTTSESPSRKKTATAQVRKDVVESMTCFTFSLPASTPAKMNSLHVFTAYPASLVS